MSSFSSIKRFPQEPSELNISEFEGDDFVPIPKYQLIGKNVGRRPGKLRGRVGVEELAQIVGSRNYRDVKRSANFMPGQFELWNKNEKGGNGKYWGGYQDVDDDGINEFVVRRGEDNTGPMIAVNGYTTKRSDWGARELYYQDNPTKALRSENGPLKKYMHKFYGPTYDKKTGKITEWGIKPGSDEDPLHNKMYDRYIKYTPKNLSPYQAFQKYVVTPALDSYLSRNSKTREEFFAEYGVGGLSQITSNVYQRLVKDVIFASLGDDLKEIAKVYIANRQVNDPTYGANQQVLNRDLFAYVFTRKDVKAMTSQLVYNILAKPDAYIAKAIEIIAASLAESAAPSMQE